RRHTRSDRDWSSDVCSSDLDWVVVTSKRRDEDLPVDQLLSLKLQGVPIFSGVSLYERITGEVYHRAMRSTVLIFDDRIGMTLFEIGRASCRERVQMPGLRRR